MPIQKALKRDWKSFFTDNASYKLVALCVTLILWVTILGRRDFALTREVKLDFLLPSSLVIAENSVKTVEVQVNGPRMAVKKFSQRSGPLAVDLAEAKPGMNNVRIRADLLDIPFGVKVVKITPERFVIYLEKAKQKSERSDENPE